MTEIRPEMKPFRVDLINGSSPLIHNVLPDHLVTPQMQTKWFEAVRYIQTNYRNIEHVYYSFLHHGNTGPAFLSLPNQRYLRDIITHYSIYEGKIPPYNIDLYLNDKLVAIIDIEAAEGGGMTEVMGPDRQCMYEKYSNAGWAYMDGVTSHQYSIWENYQATNPDRSNLKSSWRLMTTKEKEYWAKKCEEEWQHDIQTDNELMEGFENTP